MPAQKSLDVLPIPIDTERFSPPRISADPGIVGIAGRHTDPRKNAGLALHAVAAARRHGAGISLRIAGGVSNELRAQAEILGISDAVHFLGTLSDEDLPKFYRGLDILLIPSHQEGLNIAGLEAGACGVPIVTTRCGGPEDYVIDGETGFVTGFDPMEIADRLSDISTARVLRKRFSQNLRVLVKAEYGEALFALKLGQMWQSIWNEPLSAVSKYPIVESAGSGVEPSP
jgi:glycosyltransferase involved in cell wall biosynthesis